MDPELSKWDEHLISGRILAAYERLLLGNSELLSATYSHWWSSFSISWFRLMAHFFEFDSFTLYDAFTAWIGISNVFPRDLLTFEFLVPSSSSQKMLVRLCAHETCHFYFYGKLLESFPNRRKYLLGSRRLWVISEMLVPLIFATESSRAILGPQPFSTYACSQLQLDNARPLVELRMKEKLSFPQLLAAIEGLTIGES
jgi:hypothetical protein